MIFGSSGGCGVEAAQSENGEDEREVFITGSSFLPKMDASIDTIEEQQVGS
jgi:hypothetical protein